MKIGLIGNGKHSKRIQDILEKKKLKFFIYKPKKPKYYNKSEFKKLEECKIIFILSPNKTHFYYLKLLSKKRFIFCEKPPVTNKKDLYQLKKMNYKKIFFNFNRRFSSFSEVLKKTNDLNLGKIIYGSFITSHGFAQKKDYQKNWRSKKHNNKKGIFETVSIHDVDLLNHIYGIKNITIVNLDNTSGKGDSIDTASAQIILKNNSKINIFSTYNSAYNESVNLLFENGLVIKNYNSISIYSPANTFNKKGFFIKPPIILKKNISSQNDYNESLKNSVDYFLKIAKKKLKFNKKDFICSINSNELILS